MALLAAAATALFATSCSGAFAHPSGNAGPVTACTRSSATSTLVLVGPATAITGDAARALFTCAPVVVIASASQRGDVRLAAADAERAHAPLLLSTAGAHGSPAGSALQGDLTALRTRIVLAVGPAPAGLHGVQVVSDPRSLPPVRLAAPLRHVVLLTRQGDVAPATAAAVATARAAGASVIDVRGYDPRADPKAITSLSAIRPRRVLAVGTRFGPAGQLAYRVAVASTGVQLPGGGQVMFPMRRLVALYGHPGTPGLGALGEQDLTASIARARQLAALYRPLSGVPVVPTFEIIATVAQGADAPGPGGTYSYQTPVAMLRPWITQATAAHMYVVLDLQAGRASLLAQAKWYQRLLELPNVGLALDPEWKLQPGQLPLQQIGSVSAAQVNSVINWLANLTARYHLPQKLLVLHQFRLSMITDENGIDTHHDDLAIVIHMDGQGTPGEKHQTWLAVTHAAPSGVFFGWKNFFTKDHPMLTPQQTMAHSPKPYMISYQ